MTDLSPGQRMSDDGATHYYGDGCDDDHGRAEAHTPGEAVQRGLCPVCLGHGVTFHIDAGAEGPCTACGGSKTLDGMTARQCTWPDCPDHPKVAT